MGLTKLNSFLEDVYLNLTRKTKWVVNDYIQRNLYMSHQ